MNLDKYPLTYKANLGYNKVIHFQSGTFILLKANLHDAICSNNL